MALVSSATPATGTDPAVVNVTTFTRAIGNRLVVVAAHRAGFTGVTVTPGPDAGWTTHVANDDYVGDSNHRRGVTILSCVIDATLDAALDSLALIAVDFTGSTSTSVVAFCVEVDEGAAFTEVVTAFGDNGDAGATSSVSTGTTGTASAGDVLVIAGVTARGGTSLTSSDVNDTESSLNEASTNANSVCGALYCEYLTGASAQTYSSTITFGIDREASAAIVALVSPAGAAEVTGVGVSASLDSTAATGVRGVAGAAVSASLDATAAAGQAGAVVTGVAASASGDETSASGVRGVTANGTTTSADTTAGAGARGVLGTGDSASGDETTAAGETSGNVTGVAVTDSADQTTATGVRGVVGVGTSATLDETTAAGLAGGEVTGVATTGSADQATATGRRGVVGASVSASLDTTTATGARTVTGDASSSSADTTTATGQRSVTGIGTTASGDTTVAAGTVTAATFDPADADLALWLDASTIWPGTVTVITEWPAVEGGTLTAPNGATVGQTWTPAATPTVTLDRVLEQIATLTLTVPAPWTLALVIAQADSPAQTRALGFRNTNVNYMQRIGSLLRGRMGTVVDHPWSPSDADFHVWWIVTDGANSEVTLDDDTPTTGTLTGPIEQLTIGSFRSDAPSLWATVSVPELLLFPTNQTANRTKIVDYLTARHLTPPSLDLAATAPSTPWEARIFPTQTADVRGVEWTAALV